MDMAISLMLNVQHVWAFFILNYGKLRVSNILFKAERNLKKYEECKLVNKFEQTALNYKKASWVLKYKFSLFFYAMLYDAIVLI